MTKVGYMRASTQEQCPDRQADGLRDRCDRLCLEIFSAVSPRRPVYDAVIAELRPDDTLVVTRQTFYTYFPAARRQAGSS